MTNSEANGPEDAREGPRCKRPSYVTPADFIDLAVEFEVKSEAYYRNMVDRTEASDARDLLDLLARQESEHARILREYEVPESGTAHLQFPPDLTLSMPEVESESPSFEELLDVAIQREVRSARIYRNTADQLRGEFRELLEGLAVFEREHEERLRSLQEYY